MSAPAAAGLRDTEIGAVGEGTSPTCFHCGLPIPPGLRLTAEVAGEARPMCCIGCCAVAELIDGQGLSDYYRRREEPSGLAAETLTEALDRIDGLEGAGVGEAVDESERARATLRIEGITCAACVWVIERHLTRLEGVLSAHVGLSTHRARVEWDATRIGLRDVILRLAEIGFAARPDAPGERAEAERRESRAALIRLGLAGLAAMNVMTYSVALYAGAFEGMGPGFEGLMRWLGLLVATPVVAISARPFFSAALRDLRLGAPGMDVPVALAIGGAFGVSAYATLAGTGEVYFDSVCMFTFFLSLGRYLEMRIRHRAASRTRLLADAAPAVARLVRDGEERVVAAGSLACGDRFRVRPGESVPADGIVREGRSAVEEALLTGEPWPRSVARGMEVVAGCVNVESPLLVEATRVGDDTTLAQIVRLIERAESERPPIARIADRVARVFVVAVLGVAAVNAFVWWQLSPESALWTTLAVLVATCPCALSLATPAALAAATHGLADAGLLVTRASVLEGLATADRFVFDKTGTLSLGRPALARVLALRGEPEAELLAVAARLERDSEHPLGRALVDASVAAGVDPLAEAEGDTIRARPGFGIEGRVAGRSHRIGRPSWACGDHAPPAAPDADALVWLLLADDEGPRAWFGLDDPLREAAPDAIEQLGRRGLSLEMLSGDPSPTAGSLATRLGLEVARVAATPEEKVERVNALQRVGETVVVVGDGVNDGPVLRAGDVSIAMGSGCDLSRLGSDAVLLRDDLGLLPRAIDAARRMRRVLVQNFGWAIGYNLLVLPLAVTGNLPPWLAALGMSTSSLVVVLNALRLSRLPESS